MDTVDGLSETSGDAAADASASEARLELERRRFWERIRTLLRDKGARESDQPLRTESNTAA